MSTDYRPLQRIRFAELFDGHLEAYGVNENLEAKDITEGKRCLTDGRNYLWTYADEHGFLDGMTRWGFGNAPQRILRTISEAFDTEIVSEYEPEFWGFATQEEWDAAEAELAKKRKHEFYLDLLKHLRGEATDIRPGTIGMIKAQIAEGLVAQRPDLMLPSQQDELLRSIDVIYERDHVVRVELTEQDLALAGLAGTHEGDLPSA